MCCYHYWFWIEKFSQYFCWNTVKFALQDIFGLKHFWKYFSKHSVKTGLKHALFIFIPPFISNHSFHKNKHTHLFVDVLNIVQIYTTPLNTTISFTSKSYWGIKLVWIWRISTWLKLFKYINHTQNKITIFALMHNIRTHPFYFWYTLYTQTPFFNSAIFQIFSNPPFLKHGLHTIQK